MKILIVDDDKGISELMKESLSDEANLVDCVYNGEGAIEYLENNNPDLAIFDFRLPDYTANNLIPSIIEKNIEIPPFIVSTGMGDEKTAVEMMKLGARDYIIKDLTFINTLPNTVKRITKELVIEQEKIKAEAELERVNSINNAILESLEEALHFMDDNFVIQFSNDKLKSWSKELGMSDSINGKLLIEAFPFLSEDVIAEYRKVLQEKIVVTTEDLLNFDDVELITKTRKIPVVQNDKVIGVLTIIEDITDRRKFEDALIESEERFKFAMNASRDGLYDWNLKTNEIYYSPGYKKILGFEEHELDNDFSVWENFTHPDDVKLAWENLKNHLEGKTDRFEMEFRMRHKKGHWVNILSRANAIFNSDGEPYRVIGTHVDISYIKKIEQSLINSKEILNQAECLAKMGSWELDLANNSIEWSDGIYELFDLHESVKPSFETLFNHAVEEHKIIAEETFNNFLNGKVINRFEYSIKTNDNNIKFLLATTQAKFNQDNELIKLIGSLQDFTEITLAKEELLNERNRSVGILVATNAGTWDWDIKNGNVIFNEKWAEIRGFKLSELEPISFNTFTESVHPDDLPNLDEKLKLIFDKKKDYFDAEFRQSHKDGGWVWVNSRGKVIEWSDDNKPLRMSGTHLDITEKKEIEIALKSLTSSYAGLSGKEFFEAVSRHIAENTDLDYVYIGEYDKETHSVSSLGGYANGKELSDLTYDLKDTPCEKVMGKELCYFYKKVQDLFPKDILLGEMKIESYIGSPLFSKEGNPLGILVGLSTKEKDENNILIDYFEIFIDRITAEIQRMKAERALIEAQRLRAMGEMASAVAHDFNNSLQAIEGNIELIYKTDGLSAELKKYLGIIENVTQDASNRVKVLQRFSGKSDQSSSKVKTNIKRLVEEVINQTRPLWKDMNEKKGCLIQLDSSVNPDAFVCANPSELRTVFFNIIKNSIESFDEDGLIKVESESNDSNLTIRFSDTGRGMTEDIRSRAFEPFFTTKGFESGRGLGLSGALSIIKEHGGDLTILESNAENGTVIEIQLPLQNDSCTEEVNDKENFNVVHVKVLWVDDDPLIRENLSELLEAFGYRGRIVESGEKALEVMKNNSFDIVITDVGMPGMNGWQLADKIKELYGNDQKIGIVSGWGSEISKEELANHNINFLLEKPVKMEEVNRLISQAFLNEK